MSQARARLASVISLRREGTSLAEVSDEGLLAACATGDRAARAALFERHVDGLHRFVRRMTAADADAVDDLVQNTFIEAFRCAGTFRHDGRARTWLYGIAVNVVRNYARREIRRKQALGELERAAVAPTHVGAERRVLAHRLEQLVPALRPDLREAFVLVDVEGLSGAEAAAAAGVPEGTLWRRLHDARKVLRAGLEGTP